MGRFLVLRSSLVLAAIVALAAGFSIFYLWAPAMEPARGETSTYTGEIVERLMPEHFDIEVGGTLVWFKLFSNGPFNVDGKLAEAGENGGFVFEAIYPNHQFRGFLFRGLRIEGTEPVMLQATGDLSVRVTVLSYAAEVALRMFFSAVVFASAIWLIHLLGKQPPGNTHLIPTNTGRLRARAGSTV